MHKFLNAAFIQRFSAEILLDCDDLFGKHQVLIGRDIVLRCGKISVAGKEISHHQMQIAVIRVNTQSFLHRSLCAERIVDMEFAENISCRNIALLFSGFLMESPCMRLI